MTRAANPSDSSSLHPPRARLTLRVGVTGHRPEKLRAAEIPLLRQVIRGALERVCRIAMDISVDAAGAYAAAPPGVRVISPLAEGADRILAQEALGMRLPARLPHAEEQPEHDLHFELQCPLPFAQSIYEDDFAGPSIQEFRSLLAHATAVVALDGQREREDEAYAAVGDLLVNQSDVLIAIWDGRAAEGPGGTAEVVHLAARARVPVIWIHSAAPHAVQILLGDSSASLERANLAGVDELAGRLRASLLPPSDTEPAPEHQRPLATATYFGEVDPRPPGLAFWRWIGVWQAVVALAATGRLHPPWAFPVPDQASLMRAWRLGWGSLPAPTAAWIDRSIVPHHIWADRLSIYYASRHRSAFVVNYALGIVAVLLALLDLPLQLEERPPAEALKIAATLTIICLIIVNTWIGTRRAWHERWIDYRLLAELLRQLRYLAVLGRVPSLSRLPDHNAYGDPRGTWMAWHVRAIARETGLPSVTFDAAYLDAYRVLLHDRLVDEQIVYHQTNAARLNAVDQALRGAGRIGFSLVAAVLLVALGYTLVDGVLYAQPLHLTWLPFVEAGVPALGGALAAIRVQADLERLVRRSHAMVRRLRDTIVQLEQTDASYQALTVIAESAANAMIAELLDWRLVAQDRPLELPDWWPAG